MKNNGFEKIRMVKNAPSERLALPGSPWAAPHPNQMVWTNDQYSPRTFKINLYRFLRDNIPLLSSCIWTWSRLSSAPGRYEILDDGPTDHHPRALRYLEDLALRLNPFSYTRMAGLESFLPLLYGSLYTDGAFAGFLILNSDLSGIASFQPIDTAAVIAGRNRTHGDHLILRTDHGDINLDRRDFYYLALDTRIGNGLGRSILSSIPFVAYIEQQLVDDMRRATHNAGYHRLHVQVSAPEKITGETDEAYLERANAYFDETVNMIKSCTPEDNPVTWDNIKVEYIGPRNIHGVTSSWFLNHRAMVEEICAGANLSPFMLGFSYGTTHNWAQFKYDLVMRQVVSIQRQTARFLEWLGNIELALKGFDCKCRYIFDNTLTYLASDRAQIEKGKIDSLLKLYDSGLLSKTDATARLLDLI